MKSLKSALRSRPQRHRARPSRTTGLVPLGAALVPLAMMTWVFAETGFSGLT